KRSIMIMKRIAILASVVWFLGASAQAQPTAFTYQGRLNDNGAPAAGIYDLRFTIHDAVTLGNPIGTALTNSSVAVSNGLFTAQLDFGAAAFNGPARWLEIGVRTNGAAAYVVLSPRSPITATPYAIQAINATTAV